MGGRPLFGRMPTPGVAYSLPADRLAEQGFGLLQMRREQYGISYISILNFPGFADIETFSPVVARLTGT